jgi:hypothetical protein
MYGSAVAMSNRRAVSPRFRRETEPSKLTTCQMESNIEHYCSQANASRSRPDLVARHAWEGAPRAREGLEKTLSKKGIRRAERRPKAKLCSPSPKWGGKAKPSGAQGHAWEGAPRAGEGLEKTLRKREIRRAKRRPKAKLCSPSPKWGGQSEAEQSSRI